MRAPARRRIPEHEIHQCVTDTDSPCGLVDMDQRDQSHRPLVHVPHRTDDISGNCRHNGG